MTKKIVNIPEHRQVSSTPNTPNAGYQKIYAKSDGNWYGLDDLGVETLLGGSSYTGAVGMFVYRPNGGINEGIVYDDFELLMLDLEAWPGRKELLFDRSALIFGAQIEIPVRGSGAWDFSDTTFRGLLSTYDGINPSSWVELNILDGNTWSNFPEIIEFCYLEFNNSADPVYTISDGGTYIIALNRGSTIINNGSIEAIRIENASTLLFAPEFSDISSGIYEVFNVLDSSELNMASLARNNISSNIVRGEATA